MGFLDRRLTRSRTAPASVPVRLPLDLAAGAATDAAVVVGAVVRGAVLGVRTDRAESTALRGQQSGLASAFATKPSTVWVERAGGHAWTVSLGVMRVDGLRAEDWSIAVQVVRSPGGAVAEISTPEMLTTDGALANGKIHDRIREALAAGFDGTSQGWEAEDRISGRSLLPGHPLLAVALPRDLTAAFEAVTSLPPATVLACLDRIALPPVAAPPGAPTTVRHWRLGLSGGAPGRGFAEVQQAGSHTVLRGGARVPRGADELGNTVAALAANALVSRLRAHLGRLDPEIRWTGADPPFAAASGA